MTTTTTETTDGSLSATEESTNGESSRSVSPQVLRLRLKPNENQRNSTTDQKRVKFSEEVVDNEGMGRKSSKCCCVYHKPHTYDQSSDSSDSDGETDHCFGHKSFKKK